MRVWNIYVIVAAVNAKIRRCSNCAAEPEKGVESVEGDVDDGETVAV